MQGAKESRLRCISEEARPKVGASSKEKARLNWGTCPHNGQCEDWHWLRPFIPVHSLPTIARGMIWLFHTIRRKEKRPKAIRLRRTNIADLSAGIVADDSLMVDQGMFHCVDTSGD